jgi:hypothetical protein
MRDDANTDEALRSDDNSEKNNSVSVEADAENNIVEEVSVTEVSDDQ